MSVETRRAALQSGHDAEAFVEEALAAARWTTLDRNWRGGGGELDRVVVRDGMLRFVEVRARATDDVPAEETISPSKQRKLRRAAEAWMLDHIVSVDEIAFLVALVDLSTDPWSVTWIDNAFDVS